ncbi:MAG: hypothetical protein LUE29_01030 [Lachnospiraceae bacterium]|nr:hypothetical protein [Lachnospiraceae bacterium]
MTKIFVGLILIFLDINLDVYMLHFDLLPDFIGFALLFLGMREQVARSKYFRAALAVDAVLFVGTLCEWIFLAMGLVESSSDAVTFFDTAENLCMFYLTFCVVQTLVDSEKESGYDFDAVRLQKTWRCWLAVSVAVMVAWLFIDIVIGNAISVWSLWGLVGIALACVNFVVLILFLYRFYRSKEKYEYFF